MDKNQLSNIREEIKQLKLEKVKQEKIASEAKNKIYSITNKIEEKENEIRLYDYYDAVRFYLTNSKYPEKHWIDRDTTTRDLMTHLSRGTYSKIVRNKTVEKQVDYYIINNRRLLTN